MDLAFLLFLLVPNLHFTTKHAVKAVCPENNITEPIPLYFALMVAESNESSFISAGTIPAIQLAVDLVNNNSNILPDYKLSYNGTVFDTRCDRTTSLEQFFGFIETPPTRIAIVGSGCSAASEPVAEISPFWNLPVVSFTSASPLLSNRRRYPLFYRTYPSDVIVAPAFVTLIQSFGWKRVCIISQNEPVLTENLRTQMSLLEEVGIEVSSSSFTFQTDERPDISSVLDTNVNVFFINMFQANAIDVFCQFYRNGIRYPSYAFITHGWYSDGWYRNIPNDFDCTLNEILTQLDRVIAFLQSTVAENEDKITDTGLSANQFDKKYRMLLKDTSYIYQLEAYTAFDAIYSLAFALDKVQRAVCEGNDLGCDISRFIPLEEYNYTDGRVTCMLNNSLDGTNFQGVSGTVKFDEDGTRILDLFRILQYQKPTVNDITFQLVGFVNISGNGSFRFLNESFTNDTIWPEGVPPDGIPIKKINTVLIPLIVIMDIFAAFGVIFAIVCLIFTIVFRNKKIVKLTSPNLNYIVIVGALFMYGSVFSRMLPNTDQASLDVRCYLAYWLTILGYTLSFSAVLAKMWRVYYIFHNPGTKKRTLTDWHLLLLVAIINAIAVLLLIIGEAIPQTRHVPTLVEDKETPSVRNSRDVLVMYCVYSCYPTSQSIAFQAVNLSYLAMLQVIAIVLAFQTRKVKIKALNDAKQVTAIIYATSICIVILILTSFALEEFINTSNALFSVSIMAATTVFLGLIFIPKMVSLYRDPKGENVLTTKDSSSTNGPSSMSGRNSAGNIAILMGTEDPKATITRLEGKIAQLKGELQKYESWEGSYSFTPSKTPFNTFNSSSVGSMDVSINVSKWDSNDTKFSSKLDQRDSQLDSKLESGDSKVDSKLDNGDTEIPMEEVRVGSNVALNGANHKVRFSDVDISEC